MIRYYAYYNCGGYKDMYIGDDGQSADSTYFIPLLPVWKARNKPGDEEKIAKAETVSLVKLITNTNSYGFPCECCALFSHGGYRAIYQTLQEGSACFCIKDIYNDERDEENRRIPFNFLLVAEGEESKIRLDGLALLYLRDSVKIEQNICDSISYEPVINAIKFDLQKLGMLFPNDSTSQIEHDCGKVVYLKAENFRIALKELNLRKEDVAAFCDENGNVVEGEIPYLLQRPPLIQKSSDSNDVENLNNESMAATRNDGDKREPDVMNDCPTSSDKDSICKDQIKVAESHPAVETEDLESELIGKYGMMETYMKSALRGITDLSESMEFLKNQLQLYSSEVNERYNQLETLIDTYKRNGYQFPVNKKVKGVRMIVWELTRKEIILILFMLILGIILGALLF